MQKNILVKAVNYKNKLIFGIGVIKEGWLFNTMLLNGFSWKIIKHTQTNLSNWLKHVNQLYAAG